MTKTIEATSTIESVSFALYKRRVAAFVSYTGH